LFFCARVFRKAVVFPRTRAPAVTGNSDRIYRMNKIG